MEAEKIIPFLTKELLKKDFEEDIYERLAKAIKKDKEKGLVIDFKGKLWSREKVKFNYEVELY